MIKRWFSRALLLGIAAGVVLCIFEIGLRLGGLYEGSRDPHTPYPRYYFVRDEESGFDLAESFPPADFTLGDYADAYGGFFKVWTNELGCFDAAPTPGAKSPLFVGDSFTWGFVPFERTWASVVEREVGTRVVKCGVGAYGTRQARLKAEKVSRRIGPPSLVVLGYCNANDLIDDYLFPQVTVSSGYLANRVILESEATGSRRVLTDEQIEAARREALEEGGAATAVRRFIARNSATYDLILGRGVLHRAMARLGLVSGGPISSIPLGFRSTARYAWLEGAWKAHLDNLRELGRTSESMGAKLLVVIIPTREQVYRQLRPRDAEARWDQPDVRLGEALQRDGIAYLDVLDEFQKRARDVSSDRFDAEKDLYWRHDPHLNLTGNRLLGLMVSRYILGHGLVEAADREKRLEGIERELSRLTGS